MRTYARSPVAKAVYTLVVSLVLVAWFGYWAYGKIPYDGEALPENAGASIAQIEAATYPVRCETVIDVVDALPTNYVELAGVIALPTPSEGMQVGRSANGYRFSKFGMAIRPGAVATVRIEAANGDAYLDYGDSEPLRGGYPPSSMRFGPCPATQNELWYIHAGGIWTTEDGCVAITVVSSGVVEEVAIGIGVAC